MSINRTEKHYGDPNAVLPNLILKNWTCEWTIGELGDLVEAQSRVNVEDKGSLDLYLDIGVGLGLG